jgi:hypothetical protein
MDEISKLVDETFNLLESPQFYQEIQSANLELPEEVPGVLYYIQRNSGTFVIRIYPSHNLAKDFADITINPKITKKLRMDSKDLESINDIKFFECDCFELAKMIQESLGNQRFPLFEENVINVSDPGYSWWMSGTENSIRIYFKLSKTAELDSLFKIGPLGDPKLAMKRFALLQDYFAVIFPLSVFASAHGQLHMEVSEGTPLFWEFQNLLKEGDASFDFWDFLQTMEAQMSGTEVCKNIQKANYYLMQLSVKRKFWKVIQEDIIAADTQWQ